MILYCKCYHQYLGNFAFELFIINIYYLLSIHSGLVGQIYIYCYLQLYLKHIQNTKKLMLLIIFYPISYK